MRCCSKQRRPRIDYENQPLQRRKQESDEFYDSKIPARISEGGRTVARQECAGLLWSKLEAGRPADSLAYAVARRADPVIAVEVIETSQIEKMPGFKKRMEWFLGYRSDLKPLNSMGIRAGGWARATRPGGPL